MQQKFCIKCNVKKDLDCFYKWKKECKPCYLLDRKKYKEKNKKELSSKNKIWHKNNKEAIKKYAREYQKNKRKNDILFNLRSSLSRNIRVAFSRNGFAKNSNTINIIGCSFEELKSYLEAKFEPWMNWNNKGLYNGQLNYGWDIDHLIPLSSAKTEEELLRLNHYTNLQPLCSKINRDIKRDSFKKE